MKTPFRISLISTHNNVSDIGLRQISACLKSAGRDVRMIFLPDPEEKLFASRPWQQDYSPAVLDQICDLCADAELVGISLMSNMVPRARALTQAIHDRLAVPVLWGGIHPTVKPEECLNWADLVCVGEGEEAALELVDRMAAGQDYADIPNIWLKDGADRIIINPVRPLNRSLDDLPLPDYALGQHYVLHRGKIVPLTPALLAIYLLCYFAKGQRVAYVIYTARGCPYNCAYCGDGALFKVYPDWKKLRRRSPERVIAELEAARRVIPAMQAVVFADNTFLAASADAIRRFSAMYRERIGLPFFILATPSSISREKLGCLVEAGLQDLQIGIQTGSPRIRELYNRPESNKEILAAARCVQPFRKWIPGFRYDIISDNPYETQADYRETLNLLYQLPRPFRLWLYSLTFYPGTDLYRRAKADGLVQDDEQDIYRKDYLRLEPTYYNFMLWGLNRNLPRWLLWPLIQPWALKILGSPAMKWLFRAFWKGINTWYTRQARRAYLEQVSRLTGGEP